MTTLPASLQPACLDWVETLVRLDTTSRESNLGLIEVVRDHLLSKGVTSTLTYDRSGKKANLFATVPAADGRTNGGIILDIVHVVNLGISYEAVSRIPLQYLINVELNDGTLLRSPRHDPARARRFCGEGEFDIRGFIAAVRKSGYSNPWAVEVFSNELVGWSLDELNTKAYQTTMAQFEL